MHIRHVSSYDLVLSGYRNQRTAGPSKWPATDGSYSQQQNSVVRSARVSLIMSLVITVDIVLDIRVCCLAFKYVCTCEWSILID